VDETLRQLYEEDQADRRQVPILGSTLRERDRARRQTVTRLIETGALQTPEDHYHAAMVFQHGETLDDYSQAHELAKRAAELGYSPERRARWLAAAALDRSLMHQDKPQKYGTQYRWQGDEYRLWPVDPETTDAEREAWGVPPLEEAQQRAAQLTREHPPTGFRPVLATLEVPLLRVRLALSDAPPPPPGPGFVRRPQKITPEEMTAVEAFLPRELPADCTAGRVGEGFCALRADGTVAASWSRVGPRRSADVTYLWRAERGPAPSLERVDLNGRAAVWIKPHADDRPQRNVIMLPIDSQHHWTVGGELPLEELLRLAVGLPGGDV